MLSVWFILVLSWWFIQKNILLVIHAIGMVSFILVENHPGSVYYSEGIYDPVGMPPWWYILLCSGVYTILAVHMYRPVVYCTYTIL
jgi:hypothetical protein